MSRKNGSSCHRPEHPGVPDPQVLARQHVVGAQVARAPCRAKSAVSNRGSDRCVRLAPPCSAAASTAPALVRRGRRVDPRVVEQLLDRARDAVAVERVGVLVARDDELRSRREAAAAALVVVDVAGGARRDVVGPEPDLVEVARAVAVLGAVEHRWRRVADEEVHGAACRSGSAGPSGSSTRAGSTSSSAGEYQSSAAGVAGSSGRRAPGMSFHRKFWNVRIAVEVDRVLRVDRHAELAGEEAEAEARRPGPPTTPLLFRSKPGGDAGVGRRREARSG